MLGLSRSHPSVFFQVTSVPKPTSLGPFLSVVHNPSTFGLRRLTLLLLPSSEVFFKVQFTYNTKAPAFPGDAKD